MKLISVQLFTIFVPIYCFQGVSMQFMEDNPSTSLPINPSFPSNAAFNPSFTANPVNPSSTLRPFNPSSTFSSYIPSSTFRPFNPASTYNPFISTSTFSSFNPSDYSSSSNVATFLVQQPTTASTLPATNDDLIEYDTLGRRFLTASDVVPVVVNIPIWISDRLKAIRRLIVSNLSVMANTLDLFISSIQMGKSNVHLDLVNIGKSYIDIKDAYLILVELISVDLTAVSTRIRKLPGIDYLKFFIEGPLEMIQTFKNFLMSLVKPEDTDFQI
ncbi:uncharacterized protein LOC123293801 [Chrysoperla carnea]|uniref:uncharacterized protein LOC123293801 n=1 Tax=Chrysoperla carnea TaxID=189513 RepID=UPI001D0654F9|nr:uncharacterized protein LOC123293801 [Chrysoperla carnea]